MPAIPEFVLRKLFVPGSLKPDGAGFRFELNNTFAPVTLLGLGLNADGVPCPAEGILISLPGQDELCAAAVTADAPRSLPVNQVVGVRVSAAAPRKALSIRAVTREAGVLQFSIPLGGARAEKAQFLLATNLLRRVRRLAQELRVRPDPQRPRLHFAAPANWLNDPNGLIYWQGKYHLFYQHNPQAAVWGNIHWGHTVSTDLLRWKHLPVALAPSPDGADAGGCFSGCAVPDGGRVALLYTGVYPETQCLARSTDADLLRWQKHPRPVIPAPPAGLALEGFRDPCVWQEGAGWRLALGSGLVGAGGAVLLYRSLDLVTWEYLGILCHDPSTPGQMWECPSFFPLGGKWVLIYSPTTAEGGLCTLYLTGDYHDSRFIPDGPARLLDDGAGGCFYAPQTFTDAGGRRVMFGWLREARTAADQLRAGWSGMMSLPRVLSLDENGELHCAPLQGLEARRALHERLDQPGQTAKIVRGGCFEAQVSIAAGSVGGLALLAQNEVIASLAFAPARGGLVLDCSRAGGLISRAPLDPAAEVHLRVYVDGSAVEVYIEGRQPISARFYPSDPRGLHVGCTGQAVLELWNLD